MIQLIISYTNGTSTTITKCLEKLNTPNTSFTVYPNEENAEIIIVCKGNPISFENLTTTNGGHDDLYYAWDFDDPTGNESYSNEYEPTYTFYETGTYEVKLTVRNGCSCSSSIKRIVIVIKSDIIIDCPSMACEGDRVDYTIQNAEKYRDCGLKWEFEGATKVWESDDHTRISLIWDNLFGEDGDIERFDGFGYVSVFPGNCGECTSTVKIPIISTLSMINGNQTICEGEQATFTLPQWATTEFNWVLTNETGEAIKLQGNKQRNQIIVHAESKGTVKLSANYYNTLLDCGGFAPEITIRIKESLDIENTAACTNTDFEIEFINSGNETKTNIDWKLYGSNDFYLEGNTGNTGISTVTFNYAGEYTIMASSSDSCISNLPSIIVNEKPDKPTNINGEAIICPGINYNYSCIVPNGMSAHWQIEGGSIIGANIGNEITVDFDSDFNGIYKILARFKSDGCFSDIEELPLNVFEPDFTGFPEEGDEIKICGSNVTSFSLDNIDIDDVDYINWELADASLGSIQNNGTNNITVLWNQFVIDRNDNTIIVNVRKCGVTHTRTFNNIDILTSATIINTTPTTEFCGNDTPFFSFEMGNGFNEDIIIENGVTWDFGDGTIIINSSTTSTIHTYNPSEETTNYTVTVTVKTSDCEPTTMSFDVIVHPYPIVEVSPFGINFCALELNQYNLVLNTQLISLNSTIQWFKNGILIAGETNNIITVVNDYQDHIYQVIVTNENGCKKTSMILQVKGDCSDDDIEPCIDDSVLQLSNQVLCNGAINITSTIQGIPVEVIWGLNDLPNIANIVYLPNNNLEISNLPPGKYTVNLVVKYENADCSAVKTTEFIVPFTPDFRYNLSCEGNDQYTITITDYSPYYPLTPYTTLEYFDGLTWNNTPIGNDYIIENVPAATILNIGLKISGYGLTCDKLLELKLPESINAHFSITSNSTCDDPTTPDIFEVCEDTAVFFTPDENYTALGYVYNWDFGDDTFNHAQNPYHVYKVAYDRDFTVELIITNPQGCSATHSLQVHVINNNVDGTLRANPNIKCEGSGNFVLEYVPFGNSEDAHHLDWYKVGADSTNSFVTTTTTPNLSFTTNQEGLYFVHAYSVNGCKQSNIGTAYLMYRPNPKAPEVTGKNEVCFGEEITLQVPESTALNYYWSLNNGGRNWSNTHEITFISPDSGVQNITVYAETIIDNCMGEITEFQVSVLPEIEKPIIEIVNVECEDGPYKVKLRVVNYNSNTGFYNWSNGGTGEFTTITHDGPIQVSIGISTCEQTSNVFNLPIDLSALDWTFPKGCYDWCGDDKDKLDNTYLIGPLREYAGWKWLVNNPNNFDTTQGEVDDYGGLVIGNTYQLHLETPYCKKKYENLSINNNKCERCSVNINLTEEPICRKANGVTFFELNMVFEHNFDTEYPVINLSTPNGQGYFIPSSINLNNNNPTFAELIFIINEDNFIGNEAFEIIITNTDNKRTCEASTMLRLPECNLDGERPANLNKNRLLLVPNPATQQTKIVYDIEHKGTATIQVTNLLGTIYYKKEINNTQGVINLDISTFTQGVYDVSILQNGTKIVHRKLIKK